jgi:hypothetical protein
MLRAAVLAVGADGNWLSVGTTRGYIIVYDLRFQLDVQVLSLLALLVLVKKYNY